MGASLGGLAALRAVLGRLPAGFPAAVAIVQHRRAGRDSRFAALLQSHCALEVREVEDGDPVQPGVVVLAPPDYHLLLEPGFYRVSVDWPESFARPSIDVLFETAAEAYGRRLIAVLLTASTHDGASGIATVAAAGGTTVVQDPASAESPVAPLAALARARVAHVAAPDDIGAILARLVANA